MRNIKNNMILSVLKKEVYIMDIIVKKDIRHRWIKMKD